MKKTTTTAHKLRQLSPQHLTALAYASRGFSVIPTWPNSKKPLTANGHHDATTDLDQINQWWSRTPNANVALVTNDLLAIDVDVKNGKDGYRALMDLQAQHGILPKTCTQVTPSGGMHHIYRTNGVIVPSLINCPAPGIDIRAYNGYVLVAPSVVDGKPYFMNHLEIADAPEWLINLVMNFVTANGVDNYSAPEYHESSAMVTNFKLKNADDVISITGMGHTLKVKYDPVAMKLVTL